MKVRQHIPNFMDVPRVEVSVETVSEMLGTEFIRGWSVRDDFHRFSVIPPSLPQQPQWTLMAELHEGAQWWVVAHFDPPEGMVIDLPEWKREGSN